MIVDASVVVDALVSSGERGQSARAALLALPPGEPLLAPGHHPVKVTGALRAIARRQQADDRADAWLERAGRLGIVIEGPTWPDLRRAQRLADGSLSLADAVYVAVAERHATALLTSDHRIVRSGADILCEIITT